MASLFKRIFMNEVVVEFAKDKIGLKTDEKAVEFEPTLFISSDPKNCLWMGIACRTTQDLR